MKKIILSLITCLFFQFNIAAQNSEPHPHLSGGLNLGYSGGFGIQGNLSISDFALDFPLSMRFGLGYTMVDPGKSCRSKNNFY